MLYLTVWLSGGWVRPVMGRTAQGWLYVLPIARRIHI